MSIDLNSVRKFIDPVELAVAVQLLSDTKMFIKDRLDSDNGLVKAISLYLFFIGIHVYLLSAVMESLELSFKSIANFYFLQVLFVFFMALSGYFSLRSLGINSEYKKVIHSTFYLYGPSLVISSICIMIWLYTMMHMELKFIAGFIFMSGLNVYWLCRSWGALVYTLKGTKKQAIYSFVLATLYYLPIMISFWAVSSFLGKIV